MFYVKSNRRESVSEWDVFQRFILSPVVYAVNLYKAAALLGNLHKILKFL